ncbi:Nucleotide-binding universal stress protein, UspA family [Kushneria avicenniae]|uniref:Nucleotide-binding universal stress protein, UspA family n=1 Tax=Kushneria avicenniae TaxID=402385 RepID=A0A1I1MNN6_9GAMM|nr:universal stress protein [Kushneria avicenniae]SFC87009.1 Nucleotide-binding universal stress protein, UspA family [Kushneria avicenniae]
MTQSILVPIDGSRSARRALEHACLMQQAGGGALHLLHIVEPPVASDHLGATTGSTPVDYTPVKGHEQGVALLKETWSAVGDPSGEVHFHVEDNSPGHPDQTIVAMARELDVEVIVMGSRGLSDMKGLVVGSVSHKVSHVAHCTVITLHVPDTGPDDALAH